MFLAQPLAIAEENEPERNAEVLCCASKLKVSPRQARSRTHIRKLYSCVLGLTIKESAALMWEPGYEVERIEAMSNCMKAYERESMEHAGAYSSGKRYAWILQGALREKLVHLRFIRSRDDLFWRAKQAYDISLGHVPSDSSSSCSHAMFGFTKEPWSSYHSGFSEHLSPSLKKLFWMLPER
jgi:hypothetical protein